MTASALPKVERQLILAVLMVCSLLIWLDNTVLSTALETLADPVHGLNATPSALQWATGSYTLTFATLMFTMRRAGRSLRSPVRARDGAGGLRRVLGVGGVRG